MQKLRFFFDLKSFKLNASAAASKNVKSMWAEIFVSYCIFMLSPYVTDLISYILLYIFNCIWKCVLSLCCDDWYIDRLID